MKYFLLFVCLLCGCSPVPMDEAKQEVSVFDELYQGGEYHEIYSMTSDDFKKFSPEKVFINFMIKAKEEGLGAFKKQILNFKKIQIVCFLPMKSRWYITLNILKELFKKFLLSKLMMGRSA